MPKFDVAFIGTGIAGMYAAALLSKSDRSVLLFDPAEQAGGAAVTRERDGFPFISGASIGYGFESGGPAHALLASIGITVEEISGEARYQVALPDRRITISPVLQETLSELRREFPREIDKLTQLYRDAVKLSEQARKSALSAFLLKRRSGGAYLRSRNLSRELTAFFNVQSRYFFGQDIRTVPLSTLVLLLTVAPRSFPDGLGALSKGLRTVIESNGGSVRLQEPWPELVVRRRRISGLRTEQGLAEPRTVVVNALWEPKEHTMFAAFPTDAVPVGMECSVIALPEYAKTDETIALILSRAGSVNTPGNIRTLTATFFGPVLSRESPEARAERIRIVMPFLFDFTTMTFEQSREEGRYELPKDITVPSLDLQHPMRPALPTSLKNLHLLPDSSRSLHHSLTAGNYIAHRLR